MHGREAEQVHDLLRRAVYATDHGERYAHLDRLGRLGVDAERDLPLLIDLLSPEHHWFSRSLAVWEIGKLGPDARDAAGALGALATEADVIIDPRWAALWALERLGPAAEAAVPAMLDVLAGDREPDMRSQAAAALGVTGAVEVVPALVDALSDDDSLARAEAATALGRFGPAARDSSERLVQVAGSDGVASVRRAAVRALRAVGAGEAAERAECERAGSEQPAALAALLENLASPDARTRAESTWPIGKFGEEAAPGLDPVVVQLRHDHDPDARWGAAWVVGRMGPAAAPALDEIAASAREDPDPDVRANAAQALGRIGPAAAGAVGTLVDALGDEGAPLLREEAALALARIGPAAREAVVPLRHRLADRARMVRVRAAVALAAVEGA
jgi:HEAT repeat protein